MQLFVTLPSKGGSGAAICGGSGGAFNGAFARVGPVGAGIVGIEGAGAAERPLGVGVEELLPRVRLAGGGGGGGDGYER